MQRHTITERQIPQKKISSRSTVSNKNALRAAVLAINDGLCSNFNFVMGVLGTGISNKEIIITGMVAVIAGAFSMGMGEWLSLTTMNNKRINVVKAALYSFCAFIVGSLIPLIPFLFMDSKNALINSAVICACTMFTIGVADTKKFPIRSGLRHITTGLLIAAVTYICSSFIPLLLSYVGL